MSCRARRRIAGKRARPLRVSVTWQFVDRWVDSRRFFGLVAVIGGVEYEMIEPTRPIRRR